MKLHRNLIAAGILAATFGGLTSALAANAERASDEPSSQPHAVNVERFPDDVGEGSDRRRIESSTGLRLSLEQMDQVHGGMINNDSPSPVPQYGSDGTGVTCRHLSCYGL